MEDGDVRVEDGDVRDILTFSAGMNIERHAKAITNRRPRGAAPCDDPRDGINRGLDWEGCRNRPAAVSRAISRASKVMQGHDIEGQLLECQ